MDKSISVVGASENNLKNINCKIPWYKLSVITGLSGSGKSTLAIETIHSESRRRYLESLSTYARQFLEKVGKAEFESLNGVPPSICIESRNNVKNSRSTVGTLTEIYDYMRVIFSRAGDIYCTSCKTLCSALSNDEIFTHLVKNFRDKKVFLSIENTRNISAKQFKKIGISEIIINGKIIPINSANLETPECLPLIDNVILKDSSSSRIKESIDLGFNLSKIINIYDEKLNSIASYKKELCCLTCLKEHKQLTPSEFSFNSPNGACKDCKGFGNILWPDLDLIVNEDDKSIMEGCISVLERPSLGYEKRKFLDFCFRQKINTDKAFNKLSSTLKSKIMEGDSLYKGINGLFKRLEKKSYKMHIRVLLSKYRSPKSCSSCGGSRIKELSSEVRIENQTIFNLCEMNIKDLSTFFKNIEISKKKYEIIKEPLKQCLSRLEFLLEVGLEYLTLNRLGKTLSGGEAQRVNLAQQLGSELTDTLYVLDEPSIGLHPKDIKKLFKTITNLRDLDNTIILIEHDLDIISKSDWIIELGPESGRFGGELICSGDLKKLKKTQNSITAKYLNGELKIDMPKKRRPYCKSIKINSASMNNINKQSFEIPINCITCVTGVSGSGKSTLIKDCFYGNASKHFGQIYDKPGEIESIKGLSAINEIIMVDQKPIGTSSRSNPASYMKIYDDIRSMISKTKDSKQLNLRPGDFSFNTEGGRCEDCKGEGVKVIEMQFLSDMEVVCDECNGKRFSEPILKVKLNGKNINQILGLTIKEAKSFFGGSKKIASKLDALSSVGLEYLTLGQPSNTLSGGEAQRIKIAKSLLSKNSTNSLYIMDEPSIGLHVHDLKKLIDTFNLLIENNNSVVIIEHNLDLIKISDFIIDMGPGGGSKGGNIIATGTPEEIIKNKSSVIGKYLKNL